MEVFFRRNGLPHLAESPDFREDTLRRLRPVAVALAVAAIVLAVVIDLSWWERVLVIGLPILLDRGALVQPRELRRPRADRPPGPPRPRAGLRATTSVAIRALPPLLAVLLFLSLAQETWRAFGQLEGWRFGAVLVGFGLLCSIILIAGLHRERSALYAPVPGPELEQAARLTPAAPLVDRRRRSGGAPARSARPDQRGRLALRLARCPRPGGRGGRRRRLHGVRPADRQPGRSRRSGSASPPTSSWT